MAFDNILLPYDGSAHSDRAFKTALDLAKKYNSVITVVACIDIFSTGWFGKSAFEQTLLKKLRGKVMNEIKNLEKIAKMKNISIKGKIFETSSVVRTITKFSKTHKTDLIVMGSHGRGGFDRIFLGSVSDGVAQRTPCPVLIVK